VNFYTLECYGILCSLVTVSTDWTRFTITDVSMETSWNLSIWSQERLLRMTSDHRADMASKRGRFNQHDQGGGINFMGMEFMCFVDGAT
jgi:hypothetical protein